MRALLLLLAAALAGLPFAAAQNETTSNDTAVGNDTAAGSDDATNATGNETGGTPEPAGPVDIHLEGYGEGGQFYFTLKGQTQRNPALNVQPGQQVTVHLTTVSGSVHNFCTSIDNKCTALASEGGDEVTLTFTAPEEGTFEYWCAPHRGSGMKGPLTVGAATGGAGSGGGEQEQFTGETVDLGTLGYPDCAGTKVPAASASQAVGGPTISDYVAKCRSGGTAQGEARPAHPADYVIPGSIVLIGLGIAGIAWVHRAYRP